MKSARTKIDKAAEKLIARGEDMKHVAATLLHAGLDMMTDNEKEKPKTIIVRRGDNQGVEIEWPMAEHVVKIVPQGMAVNIDRMNGLVEAVRAAGQQFLAYEESHRAKGNADADQKADVNKAMAEMCFKAVGGEAPKQNGYMLGLFPVSDTPAAFGHAVSTLVENGYERGVAHDDMMTGLFNEAFDIGEAHGWAPDTRIVLARRSDGTFEHQIVAPTTPRGQEVLVRPDFRPLGADSGDLAPVEAPALRGASDDPLDRAELVAWVDMKIEGCKKHGMTEAADILRAMRSEIEQHIESAPIDFATMLRAFYADCHERNVKAGWWSDLATGEPKKRSVGELFILFVTELVEAYDAYFTQEPDDKLPQYPGLGVELGDLQIRLADFCGALLADRIVTQSPSVYNPGDRMFVEIAKIARSYEAIRKTPEAIGQPEIGEPIGVQDVAEMTIAKLEFNATREDHKVENRKLEGGKQT